MKNKIYAVIIGLSLLAPLTMVHGETFTQSSNICLGYRPHIVLNGEATTTINAGESFVDQGAVATKIKPHVVNVPVVVTGTVNTSLAGTYTLTYSASVPGLNPDEGNCTITVSTTRDVIVVGTIIVPIYANTNVGNVSGGHGQCLAYWPDTNVHTPCFYDMQNIVKALQSWVLGGK